MLAIAIHNLKKSYGTVEALKGVSLEIGNGEFFGLLGPNGAGKTTLINALMGLVKPDAGEIRIMGIGTQEDPVGAKRLLGLTPQEVNIHNYYPINKILEFQGGFYGLTKKESRSRAEELLKKFDLWEKRDQGRYQLSGGMKRRMLIARALMGYPKILILDEPTAGLDVELRHELWQFLHTLYQEKVTIVLTTHYIEEAERLCNRVAFIMNGNIIACDTPAKLMAMHALPVGTKREGALQFVRPGSLEETFVTLTGKRIQVDSL